MKIKRKIQTLNVLPIILAAVLVVIMFSSYQTVNTIMTKDKMVEAIMTGAIELDLLSGEYIMNSSDRSETPWLAKYALIKKLIKGIVAESAEENNLLIKIRDDHREMETHFHELTELYEKFNTEDNEMVDSSSHAKKIQEHLMMSTHSMVANAAHLSDLNYASLTDYFRWAGLIVACSFVIMMIIVVTVSMVIGRSILDSILKLHTATGIIAAGNLDHSTGVAASDEMGELAHAFDNMTLQLKKSRTKLEDENSERKKAEKTVKEQRQRLFSVLDALPAFVYLQAPDYSIRFANKYYKEHFGETEGVPCYQSLWGRSEPCKVCPTFKVFETKEPQIWEWDSAPDGRIYEINDYHFTDIDGSDLVFELGIDITERKKAEQALIKEKEKLQKYLDISAVMVVMIDADQNVTLINKKGSEILGYRDEEVIGKNWFDNFLPEELRDDVKVVFEKLMAGEIEPVEYYENEVLTRSGEERMIAWYNTVFRDEKGNILATLGSGVDITERNKAARALQQSYEMFETVLDSIDGIVYVADMKTYEILYVNKYVRDIFGDLQGKVCWKTLQTDQTAPCSFCTNDKLLAADGKPAAVYSWEFQNTVNSRWYDIRDRAIEWIDGRVVRLEIAVDSTERKKAEQAIKKREKQLSESQKVARLGSWEWDIINNKIEWSDELYQIFGVDPGEFKATYEAFLDMVHPDDKEKLEAAIKESLTQKIPYHIDVRIIRTDGSEWIMEARGEVKCGQSGNPVMIGGTAQDITERKKIEEKIEASLKEKEVLIREIHHRVKNNMAVISSLLKLQAGKVADDKYREMFNDSMGRIKSMALIHEKLYRSEDMADIDLASYLEEIVTGIFSSYRLIPGKVSLKIEVENISIGIDDAIPLGLLINELVSNSLKHGFPEGREGVLRVTLRKIHQSSLIELIVSDDGVGMPEGLDFRESGSLGLNLVTTLTRQLHGEIEMSRGKGTEFRITFTERT